MYAIPGRRLIMALFLIFLLLPPLFHCPQHIKQSLDKIRFFKGRFLQIIPGI